MVLLLNAPKSEIREAARSAKQKEGIEIEELNEETMSKLLGVKGIRIKRYGIEKREKEEILHLYSEAEHEIAICPRCGKISTEVHEEEERCVRHLEIWGKRTYIHFESRRFQCEGCQKPFTEELAWLEKRRRETIAYEEHIYKSCQGSSQAKVAQEERLHAETVKGIFQRWAKRAVNKPQATILRKLGVDELSLHKGHRQFVLVLSDLERHCVIAVLSELSKEAFTQWLMEKTTAERKAIRVVAMDMWGPYRGVVQACLAQAEIVADRFHVYKHLTEAINQLRRALQGKANKADYEVLKGTRWLLVKNRADLNPAEEAKLQIVLAAFPTLRTAYLLKERFRTICDKLDDRSQAERFLQAWLWEAQASHLEPLLKFVKTLRNWWSEFLNYFNEGVTSAIVEGLNNGIRSIIRRAFGFHSFQNFRLQVLVELGDLPLPLF